jgi:hypothetical protein
MNKPNVVANNITGGLIIMVLLNWFNKSCCILKFKYDVTNTNLVDIDEPLYLLSP